MANIKTYRNNYRVDLSMQNVTERVRVADNQLARISLVGRYKPRLSTRMLVPPTHRAKRKTISLGKSQSLSSSISAERGRQRPATKRARPSVKKSVSRAPTTAPAGTSGRSGQNWIAWCVLTWE